MNRTLIQLILLLAALLLPPAAARADALALRAKASVTGDKVLLRDVADMDGPAALALADVVVAQVADPGKPLTVSLASIHDLLDAKNVNWGKLSLRGYADCQVQSAAAPPADAPKSVPPAAPLPAASANEPSTSTPPAEAAPAPAAVSNPAQPVDPATQMTLRDLVIEQLTRFAALSRDDLRFNFSPRDADTLAQSALRDRFEFQPQSGSPIGPVKLIVRQWRDSQVLATHYLVVDVSRRCLAVVATHELARGQVIAAADVDKREVFVTDARLPLSDLTAPLGQACAAGLHKGAPVYAQDLAAQLVVKAGEIITVHTAVGGLMIKVPARAAESGSIGQLIQVTNESSHERFTARVTGPRQAALILPDSAPAPLAAAKDPRP